MQVVKKFKTSRGSEASGAINQSLIDKNYLLLFVLAIFFDQGIAVGRWHISSLLSKSGLSKKGMNS